MTILTVLLLSIYTIYIVVFSRRIIMNAYSNSKFSFLKHVKNHRSKCYAYVEFREVVKLKSSNEEYDWIHDIFSKKATQDGFNIFKLGGNSFVLCWDFIPAQYKLDIQSYIDEVVREVIINDYTPIYFNTIVLLDENNAVGNDVIDVLVSGVNMSKRKGYNNITVLDFENDITFNEFGISNSGIIPFFQPVFEHDSTKVKGLETFARWSTNNQLFPPNTFIPMAIKKNLIVGIDFKILKEVFRLYEQLSLRKSNAANIPISVNISKQTLSYSFIQRLKDILHNFNNFDPSTMYFDFKLSEIRDLEIVLLYDLLKLGFKICIKVDVFDADYLMSIYETITYHSVKLEVKYTTSNDFPKLKKFFTQNDVKIIGTYVESLDEVNEFRNKGVKLMQGFYYEEPIDLRHLREKYLNKELNQ